VKRELRCYVLLCLLLAMPGCLLVQGELHHESSGDSGQGTLRVRKWGAHYDFRIRVEHQRGDRVAAVYEGGGWAPEFTSVHWRRDGYELLLCNEYGQPLVVRGEDGGARPQVRTEISDAMAGFVTKEYPAAGGAGGRRRAVMDWACGYEGRVAYYQKHPRE